MEMNSHNIYNNINRNEEGTNYIVSNVMFEKGVTSSVPDKVFPVDVPISSCTINNKNNLCNMCNDSSHTDVQDISNKADIKLFQDIVALHIPDLIFPENISLHLCASCYDGLNESNRIRLLCKRNETIMKQLYKSVKKSLDCAEPFTNNMEKIDEMQHNVKGELNLDETATLNRDTSSVSYKFETLYLQEMREDNWILKNEKHAVSNNDVLNSDNPEDSSQLIAPETNNDDYMETNEDDGDEEDIETMNAVAFAAAVYTCEHCSLESFSTKESYEEHLKIAHSVLSLSTATAKSVTVSSNDDMPRTIKTSVAALDEQEHHVYQHSGEHFLSPSHLTASVPKVQSRDSPYECIICNRKFMSQSHLNTHSLTHSNETSYTCKLCNKSFTRLSGLTRHTRIHTGDKPYVCRMCDKAFTERSTLVTHERTHTGHKPYKCTLCERTFTTYLHMTVHKRTHTGDKPYTCNVCNKAFTQIGNLIRHKRIHTGDKPHICKVCNRAFRQHSHLTVHERTHTGDKPYACSLCEKSFTQQCALLRHKRTHAGNKSKIAAVSDKTNMPMVPDKSNTHTVLHKSAVPDIKK